MTEKQKQVRDNYIKNIMTKHKEMNPIGFDNDKNRLYVELQIRSTKELKELSKTMRNKR